MHNHMKVLVFSYYPSYKKPYFSSFIHEQVKEIKKQGVTVRVVNPVSIRPPVNVFANITKLHRNLTVWWDEVKEVKCEDEYDGVNVFQPKYLPLPKWPYAIMHQFEGLILWKSLKTFLGKLYEKWQWDLIHAHSLSPFGIAGSHLSRHFRTPLVISCMGSDLFHAQNNRMLRKRATDALRYARAVIVKSSEQMDILSKDFCIDQNKVKEIWNGVDTVLFSSVTENDKNMISNAKACKILYVGHFISLKGVVNLIEALALVKQRTNINIQLSLVGYGYLENKYRDLIEKHDLINDVEFYGALPHNKIPTVISSHDVVCLPSHREGMPNIIMEALACGKPVIASDVGGIPEILPKQCGILVKPGDPNGIYEAIITAHNNSWDSKAIRDYAVSNLCKSRQVKKIISVYERCL